MKQCILFPLVVIFLSSPILIALPAPQAPHPTQIGPDSTSQPPKTTEADAQTLLAKAQRGDRKSQMWLGAAYEQGRLGKTNFEEALKWFRRAAAQGDPDGTEVRLSMFQTSAAQVKGGIIWGCCIWTDSVFRKTTFGPICGSVSPISTRIFRTPEPR
jgi:Sel1 repeat